MRYAVLPLLALVCSPLGLAFILYFQTAPLPRSLHLLAAALYAAGFFVMFGWAGFAATSPTLCIRELIGRKRREYLLVTGACWVVSWGTVPASRATDLTNRLRRPGLTNVSRNAESVVAAICKYRSDTGVLPESLADLVPEILTGSPYTGAVGYPEYEYRSPGDGDHFKEYELLVRTPKIGVNWDVFVFWPEGDYPTRIYGGTVERIGRWAYVHE